MFTLLDCRRLVIFAAAAVIGALPWGTTVRGGESERRPNIVFIYADDFGYGDLACYGHPYARTPNIDRLAKDGTRFEQFYATGVTCCPARTGFMTSKFPATFHVYPANGGFGDRVTVTELLKRQGYHTGHFGKWHIGPDNKPGTYGIDTIGASDDPAAVGRRDDTRGRDAHIYDEAIRFVETHKDGPFYINVWSHISHFPVNPPQQYIDKFRDVKVNESDFSDYMREKFQRVRDAGGDIDDAMRHFLADVASMDDSIGRLLAKIDELGLRENTIVVFSSDQGAAPIVLPSEDEKPKKRTKAKPGRGVELRLNSMGDAGGLRGGKHTMYEGGVRVPFIIRWPGHVPVGRVDAKSVTSGIDWLPTLCSITGIKIKAGDFDGEDASDAWLGKTHVRGKPLLWKTSSVRSPLAIRDGEWKLFYPSRRRGELELYNILSDPGERKNLAGEQPQIVETLSAKVEAWNTTLPKDYIKTDDKDE